MSQSEQPLVSVIIPSYNHAPYIEATINSIINQSYSNIEIIVIDDGSTDGSDIILKKLSQKHNFKFICQQNKGLCKTLNTAIKEARGKYVSPIASDDLMESDKIKSQVSFLEKNPDFDVVVGNVNFINEKNKIIGNSNKNQKTKELRFSSILVKNKIYASTALIRRKLYEDIGGYDENLYFEDWDFWLRTLKRHKIAFLPKTFISYRRHNSNMSSNYLTTINNSYNVIAKWRNHNNFYLSFSRLLIREIYFSIKFKKPENIKRILSRFSKV